MRWHAAAPYAVPQSGPGLSSGATKDRHRNADFRPPYAASILGSMNTQACRWMVPGLLLLAGCGTDSSAPEDTSTSSAPETAAAVSPEEARALAASTPTVSEVSINELSAHSPLTVNEDATLAAVLAALSSEKKLGVLKTCAIPFGQRGAAVDGGVADALVAAVVDDLCYELASVGAAGWKSGSSTKELYAQMPALVQAKDWSKTPLGAMDTWPPALRLSLDIVLSSGFPMALRWGPDFVLIYNDGYKPILGVKHPWALGLPAREVWAEVWDQIEPTHLAVLSGRQGAAFAEDLPLRLKRYGDEWDDGYFTFSYSPIPDPTAPSGVGGVLITAVETTEAVKSKARASEERDRLWTLSEDMLARADYSGNMSAVNPAWTKVLGWSEHNLLTNPYADIINPEDVGATVAALQVMGATGQPTRFENRILSKDGVWKPIGWTVSPEPDGVNFIAVGRDLADYKAREAELLRTQEALRQSQKMEAIGQLTGGIAHDFNNMLAIVIGGIDLATRRLKRGEAGAEQMLEGAREGATRAATLTQRLLAFSRQSPLSPERLNINDIVAGMSDLLRRTLGEPVAFEAVLAGGLWRCSVDRAGLESAIINLALNARDAMPSGGKLTVETCNMFLDERYANRELGVAPGQYVMVAVTDVGVGMTHDVIEKAFDPFFTTKPVGKGTGLGLWLRQAVGRACTHLFRGWAWNDGKNLPAPALRIDRGRGCRNTGAIAQPDHGRGNRARGGG